MSGGAREDFESLITEQVRPELANIDELDAEALVELMCGELATVARALMPAEAAIARAVRGVVERLERGGRLIYVGAGTAGRLGMLDAAEAGPTFNVAPGTVVGVLAGGPEALHRAVENAEDDAAAGEEAMADLDVGEADVVVGISASGRTPFVLAALGAANAAGAFTVGVANNAGSPLGALAGVAIEVAVGPEVIAGSTRLNAGTAQKVVLNVLSSASMVLLGKTYGNLMVDLRPTNEKLRERATRIVAEIASSGPDEARAALEASGWVPKVAAAMLVGDLPVAAAERSLAEHGDRLRPALRSLRARRPTAQAQRARRRRLKVAGALLEGVLVPGDLAVEDGLIVEAGLRGEGSGLAIAGLVDAQVNGYAGIDLLDSDVEQILALGRALLADGVAAYQPTLITASPERTVRALRALDEASRRAEGAEILGVHLEGPFLAPARAGTHPLEHLRAPDLALLSRYLDAGSVTTVTLAPELPGALALVELCRARNVRVSLGHSAASAEQAAAAFEVGAGAVTHLFNAMEPMSARSPGLAGAALATPGVTVQLIADGVHVADAMVRLAFGLAPRRCAIVTDAISAAEAGDGTFPLGDVEVLVESGVARRADGTLAGGTGTLAGGLKRLKRLGIATEEAVGAVTEVPARLLGSERHATLRLGGGADLVVLDGEFGVSRVVRAGEELEPS